MNITVDTALLAMLQPGAKVRHWRARMTDSPTSQVLHIRAIVDDDQVVFRVWRPGRGWRYIVKDMFVFQLWYEDGALEAVKRTIPKPVDT